ncbi:hypothetical protein [Paenibacillus sp. y28]|uniref:hypothetical protein n=1 Tax=Paenibacillus sp. y28 TaxID=3129110 RepID=UPI003018A2E2
MRYFLHEESQDPSPDLSADRVCQLGRAWAINPDGMLQRNGLLSKAQTDELETWLDMISYAVMVLLEGDGQLEEALWGYREYRKEREAKQDQVLLFLLFRRLAFI